MAVKNTIYFGVSPVQTVDSATTTIQLEDDVYLYNISLADNTTLAFDTSHLDPDKTAQGSEWGYQILLRVIVGDTLKTLTFPNGIIWEQGIQPLMNVTYKAYYIRFEFIDGVVYGYYEGAATYSPSNS